MGKHTISHRGYEIDPIKECGESWLDCPVSEATNFRIFPPDEDEPVLDIQAYTLEAAKAAIDEELRP